MIRPGYALKLARTKLHSKRGMLYTSIIVSSLLFAVLIASIIMFSGAEKSATTFIEKSNGGKYLVQTQPVINGVPIPGINMVQLTADNIGSIKAFESNYYAKQTAAYKSLNIPYTAPDVSDSLLIANTFADPGTPSNLKYRVNFNSSLYEPFMESQYVIYAKTAKNTVTDLQKIAAKYGGTGYYASQSNPVGSIPNQHIIMNGQEDFSVQQPKSSDPTPYGYFTNAIYNSMYDMVDQSLLNRYITHSSKDTLKGVPVVVSAQEAAKLFGKNKGIGAEPKSDAQKAQWLQQIQTELTGTTYQTCYRNGTELGQLQKIQQDEQDIASHIGDKTYTQPSLQYAYPTTTCGDITIKSDTRTQAEKTIETTQISNQKKLGTYIAPQHRMITYQIVGFIEAHPYSQYTDSVSDYLTNLLSYNANSMNASIPTRMYQSLPNSLKFDDLGQKFVNPHYESASASLGQRVVAFATVADARAFMQEQTCPSSNGNCQKLFTGDPYGSNYLLLDQIGKLFSQLMSYALPIVLALAAIIIWFTMSRVMAENRKETAVYRAMGAKRSDIAAIYLTYTLSVAIRIVFVSLGLGILIAAVVNQTYGVQLTNIAVASFGIITGTTPKFNLFDLSSPYIPYIVGTIIIVCFLAILQPLIRNVLRSPIRDMREE